MMSNATIKNDRTSILIEEMDKAVETALEMCGARIEERAKDLGFQRVTFVFRG